MAIRQAGLDAANQTADQASRSLLEAARTIAMATSELRIASRAATSAHPATAWRAGMLCLAGALGGSAFCAALIVFFKYL
ncbi:tropomyosin [Achromobacter denitrificans]|nr:tropomyosin [Achromobacter denitrificans]